MSLDPLGTVDDPLFPRRSRLVPAAVALVVLCGLGAGVWYLFFVPKPTVNRVLFAVATETSDGKRGEWWAARGKASARMADGLDAIFKDLGLGVVPSDPKTLEALAEVAGPDELRAAARKLSAGLLVSGTVRVAAKNPLGASEDFEFGLDVELSVVSTDEDATPMPISEAPLRFWSVGVDEEAALLRAADWLPKAVASRLAAAIAGLDTLAEYAPAAGRKGAHFDVMAGTLEPLFKLAARRAELLDQREEEAAERAEGTKDGAVSGTTAGTLGAWLDEEYFIGPGPGSGVLLMEKARTVEVRATEEVYDLRTEHERLILADADGKSRRVVYDTYNFYSYPTVSRDGEKVAAVLDRLGRSNALVAISVASGAATVLVEHPTHELSGPNMAPDGRLVAFWRTECRRGCPSDLYVVSAAGGEPRRMMAGGLDYMGFPSFSPEAKTLYMTVREQEGQPAKVIAIDVAAATSRTLLESDASFSDLAASPDGTFLVMVERGDEGQGIGRYDVASGEYRRLLTCSASEPKVSGDGQQIAFETWEDGDGDPEIALCPASGGTRRLVTANALEDKLAGWSRDGKRLFVHRGSRDPDGHAWDNRVVWIAP